MTLDVIEEFFGGYMLECSVPDVVTKNLGFSFGRKVRLSTNFLPMMGFESHSRVLIEPHEKNQGFSVVPAENGTHKVYSRRYRKGRSNNPMEAILEFGGKELINTQFPSYTNRFHVEMRRGRVSFRPLVNRAAKIHNRFKKSNPFTTFCGLTGGVDIHCLESLGFETTAVLEYRPVEARDASRVSDLSEVNALNTLVNGKPKILMNEDIYHVELEQLERLLETVPPLGFMHFSIQCDDFSGCKSKKAKQESVEKLDSTIDMIVPLLEQVKLIEPAALLVENVPGFSNSQSCQILTLQLKRMGYYVTMKNLNAREHGGIQTRKRCYLFASVAPGFEMPEGAVKSSHSIWPLIEPHLHECRDITDTQLIKSRASSKRNMPDFIDKDSVECSTILKSQDRVKDAVFIKHQGRILKPTNKIIQSLLSIPESFSASWAAKEQETEILGQSIDYAMHHRILGSIYEHLNQNFGPSTVVTYKKTAR